jgi:DNA-binding NarL/FixJ family response regulator
VFTRVPPIGPNPRVALNVGLKTVESHRTQLMQELDIHNVAGLVRYAVSVGVIAAE